MVAVAEVVGDAGLSFTLGEDEPWPVPLIWSSVLPITP